ncbi:hypothetical protein SAMN05443026_4256 [Burkholderia orbicola]|nr:hypothetical protein SAMN05443026_4256 [Burkholderia orbicola]
MTARGRAIVPARVPFFMAARAAARRRARTVRQAARNRLDYEPPLVM